MKQEEKMEKLMELIQDIEIAMLTTEDSGLLRSRPMALLDVEDESEEVLWFFTPKSSAKSSEIGKDAQVNLSFSKPDKQKYVSISGKAKVVKDGAKIEKLWRPQYKAWFPKGKDDPDLALLKVEIEAAEFWDPPSSAIVHLIGLTKAALTGESYKGGNHEKIHLIK